MINNTENRSTPNTPAVYNFGVALSGGGARGFAHLAVLKAMEAQGIKPDIFAGTSAGALVAAFYADGYEPDQVLGLFKKASLWGLMEIGLPREGLFKMTRLETFLKRYLRARRFEELKIPIYVVASDIEKGQAVVFSQGDLIPALTASCCIPVVFTPVEIAGKHYIDGGICLNMPASVIRDKCKILLGVNVSPLAVKPYNKSLKYVLERLMNYSIGANSIAEGMYCDYLIDSKEIGEYAMFALDKADEIYQKGYTCAVSYLEKHYRFENVTLPIPFWKKIIRRTKRAFR